MLQKRSLSNRQTLYSNSATRRFTRDAWQSRRNPSVLHEDGISEHPAYDMQLDTISVIEGNISKHPCSHGSIIRSYVSSHIIPSLMTGKEHRLAASCGRVGMQNTNASLFPIYHHPHHPQKRNKRPRVSQSHSRRPDQPGCHLPD